LLPNTDLGENIILSEKGMSQSTLTKGNIRTIVRSITGMKIE
jgi:hypothetical protein